MKHFHNICYLLFFSVILLLQNSFIIKSPISFYQKPQSSAITISDATNVEYFYGQTGYSLDWTIYGASGYYYTVLYDSAVFEGLNYISITSNSFNVHINVDGLNIGYHIFTLDAHDGDYIVFAESSATVNVNDPTLSNPPTLSSPSDITYLKGSTGNTISWDITDDFIYNGKYSILKDYETYEDYLDIPFSTSQTHVSCNIDGLDVGEYNFVIIASEGIGEVSDEVNVIVNANPSPHITPMTNYFYYQTGTMNHSIWWTITDSTLINGRYYVYKDGNVYQGLNSISFASSPFIVNISIDNLTSNYYTFKLAAWDGYNPKVYSEILVAVFPDEAPEPFRIFESSLYIENQSFYITWSESKNADSYSVYYYSDYITEINDSVILYLDGILTNTTLIQDISNGDYYFIVVAINEMTQLLSNNLFVVINFTQANETEVPVQNTWQWYHYLILFGSIGLGIGIIFVIKKRKLILSKFVKIK